jgi:hypothetical protein
MSTSRDGLITLWQGMVMKHSILPPHLVEQLAVKSPAFRRSLLVDAGIRTARRVAPAGTTSDIKIYDAKNQLALPGTEVKGDGPEEAKRVRGHAEATRALMGEGKPLPETDLPDLVVNYGDIYPNAFYDGQYLVFGEGDKEIFGDFTKPLEVFAHEYAHKIIDAGPQLEYAGQPGALNEHIADVVGVCVKKLAEATRNGGVAPEVTDWRIGASLFLEEGPALRDMAEPGTAYDNDLLGKDPQVGHMDDYVDTFMDNGGVHINSGIPNRAFVEAVTRMGGNAWEVPLEVWIKAMGGAEKRTDFEGFAKLTMDAANEVDSSTSEHVSAAWGAVGIKV